MNEKTQSSGKKEKRVTLIEQSSVILEKKKEVALDIGRT